MTESDVEFYQARAKVERERAGAAASSCAREVHQQLALLYDERLRREHRSERGATRM